MSVAFTSIDAYKEHKAQGKVGTQAQHILDFLAFGKDYSRREISGLTGLELSSVCGRVNELLEIGALKEVIPRKCKVTGKTIKPVVKNSLF
jgi:hypothetical protein